MDKKYLPVAILVFYLSQCISTVYLLFLNLNSNFDGYALFFQVAVISVCMIGFFSTLLGLKMAGKFNLTVIFLFSVLYGLALLNALFFGELHFLGIKEMVLYLELIFLDIWIIRLKLAKSKK